MKQEALEPQFVERFPADLDDGVLYVSMIYGTAAHKCCCGCGEKVITPFGPTDWKLIYDGDSVSLYPSIGNWSFSCQSHYWIRNNNVRWASRWTSGQIADGRERDRRAKEEYYGGLLRSDEDDNNKEQSRGFWSRLLSRIRSSR